MYECPNCGANLRYDIRSGRMACDSCDSKFDPYSISKDADAEVDQEYEVTVFHCPQCGGEVYSTDNTAASFCIFCGASTILDSRLQKEHRPGYIIPFLKTKEDCKKAYMKMVRKAFFVPKELKDEKNINEFRGVYMPYWVYYVTQGPDMKLPICNRHRSGDYTIEMHYMLNMDMDVYYKGLSYDASSSFADVISEKLAPYNVKNMKSFTPTFLSGFYADTSDVDTTLYQADAEKMATWGTLQYIKKTGLTEGHEIEAKNDDLIKSLFQTEVKAVDGAMFPVWFMAYRHHDRVAYATVNGQTGKIVADLPVDIRKYLASSALIAVPLFFLFQMFLTVTPAMLLSIIAILSVWITLKYGSQMKYIAAKESQEDDRGAVAGKRKRLKARLNQSGVPQPKVSDAALTADIEQIPEDSIGKKVKKAVEDNFHLSLGARNMISFLFMFVYLFGIFVIPLYTAMNQAGVLHSMIGMEKIILPVATVIVGVSCFRSHARGKLVTAKRGLEGTFWILFGLVAATGVAVFQPVSDYYYYGGVICLLAGMVVALLDLIGCYNIFATRPLPQFDTYRGGDNRA